MNRFVEIPDWLADPWMLHWLRLHLYTGICDLDPSPRSLALLNRPRDAPRAPSAVRKASHGPSPRAREADGLSSEGLLSATISSRDTPARSAPFLSPSGSGLLDHVGCHANRSMRPRICRKRGPVK